MRGENHPLWKGGLPYCLCGKKLAHRLSKQCKSCYAKDNRDKTIAKAKEGARKRWEGHVKHVKMVVHRPKIEAKPKAHIKEYTKPEKNTRILLTSQQKLEHKRFWNQRYKARKRQAVGNHTFEEWLLVKAFYSYMCLCCKKQEPEIKLTEDHIIPLSMGGSDSIDNIQPLCQSCNTRKHAKTISYLPNSFNSKLIEESYRREGVRN